MPVTCDDPTQDVQRVELAISELLTGIGEDGDREGLVETPARAAKAWAKWTEGYRVDVNAILKSFEDAHYNEMVIVQNIPLYSTCEHHLAAIFGTATVAYIPNGRVLGLSKLCRVVDAFARRLQTQERITVQVADALWGMSLAERSTSPLSPVGVGVQLRCRHLCMESRGVQKIGQDTVTTALRGAMAIGEARAEFLSVVNGR
jgi:GTP cyclohydrolase I